MDFFDPAPEMPTQIFFALFHHDTDRGWENESILGRIGGYIFLLMWGQRSSHQEKIYKQIIYI